MSPSKRAAFTLVELLVVISIIGVLMGLMLPAVQSARESARRANCNNSQRNLAQAVLQFHNNYRRFPGYVNATGPVNHPVSWAIMLFPYIDRNDLWTQWSKNPATTAAVSAPMPPASHPHSYIELLVCQSNPPATKTTSPCSYAVNGGFAMTTFFSAGVSTELVGDGVFFNHYGPTGTPATIYGFNSATMPAMSLSYLSATTSDGASTTLMLTENVQQQMDVSVQGWHALYGTNYSQNRLYRAVVWFNDDGLPMITTRRINTGLTTAFSSINDNTARPSSYHPQGVIAAFCDGHTRFLSQSIAYGVYKQIMTSSSRTSNDSVRTPYNEADF